MSREKKNLAKEERIYPTEALRVKLGPAVCKYRTNTDELIKHYDKVIEKDDILSYTLTKFLRYDPVTCRYRECKVIDLSLLLKVSIELPLYITNDKSVKYYSMSELLSILENTVDPTKVSLELVFDVISYTNNKYDKSFRLTELQYFKDGNNFDKIVLDSFDFVKKCLKRYINNNFRKGEKHGRTN